ncbi:MAG TPA: hypothetical protein VF622_11770 [Segetibacter sp.]|jgi:hypothetical protein
MERKEIEEGNKLIAEFMKLPTWQDGRYGKMYSSPIAEQSVFGDGGLLYDKRWDWLMPVVEKIENLDCIAELSVVYHNCCISIRNDGTRSHLISKKGNDKIESTWCTVVEFIKWYNQNSK